MTTGQWIGWLIAVAIGATIVIIFNVTWPIAVLIGFVSAFIGITVGGMLEN